MGNYPDDGKGSVTARDKGSVIYQETGSVIYLELGSLISQEISLRGWGSHRFLGDGVLVASQGFL